MDFYVILISGVNVVLCIQLLKTLDPIITGYANLYMQVHWPVSAISLQGIRGNQVSENIFNTTKTNAYN